MEKRIKFDILIPQDILEIANIFKTNGFKLFVVGGAVRDALLNQTPKDFDLATDAVPDMVEEMMAKAGFRTLPTGKAFGVINVFTNIDEYEIATFRLDLGSGRRPDDVEFTNIEGDVKRRDLTINALFFDIDTNEVVDLVGGLEDLKNGVIRTVGVPEDRFGEDRLRILRAIRFAGRFGSELDPMIDAVLLKDASLEGISGERIRDEFIKGIKSAKLVVGFLKMIDKYNLFDWVFKDVNVNKNFIEDNDIIIVLAMLLKNNKVDSLTKQLNKLKYSIDEIRAITFLISLSNLSIDTAVMLKKAEKTSGVTAEQITRFAQLSGVDGKIIDTFLLFKLTVNGSDLMTNMGLKQGPELGKEMQRLETDNFKKLYLDIFIF